MSPADALQYLDSIPNSEDREALLSFLTAHETRWLDFPRTIFSPQDRLSKLKIRQWTLERGNKSARGINDLINALAKLAPDTRIKTLNFESPDKFCIIYTQFSDGSLIGFKLVQKRSNEEQQERYREFLRDFT